MDFKESSEIEAVQVFLDEKTAQILRDIQWHPPDKKSFGNLNHLYQKHPKGKT